MSFDNIVESFSESFLITNEVNDTNRSHPRFKSYKNKSSDSDSMQEIRRKKFIESQKKYYFSKLISYEFKL